MHHTNQRSRFRRNYRGTQANNRVNNSSGNYNRRHRGYGDSDIYEDEFVNESRDNERYFSRSRNGGHNYNNSNGDRDRNIFQRAGDKIKEVWNDWRDDDRDYDDYEDNDYYYEQGGDDDYAYANRYNQSSGNRQPNRQRGIRSSNFENEGNYGFNRRESSFGHYNGLNDNNYNDYNRGRREFSGDNRRSGFRRRRREYSR
jgi:hypothetical protein